MQAAVLETRGREGLNLRDFRKPVARDGEALLHNLGLACRAVLETLLPGRPHALESIAVRFVQPGLPGDTVRVEMFDGGPGIVRFRSTAVERGVRLLDRGTCTVRGTPDK